MLWGFQNYEGVIPDIVTSAKGLSGAYLPLSMVAMRQPIKDFFETEPLGWGATYQAHPVSLACAYECIKFLLEKDLPGAAKKLQPVMIECISTIVDNHPSVRQGRAIGLFGCIDLINAEGQYMQNIWDPASPPAIMLKQAMLEEGLFGLFRPPFLHCAPPLVISEEELREGFLCLDRALDKLDVAIAA